MATWPTSLPARPLVRGLTEGFPNIALRTEMDHGPAKMRRRFTAAVRPFTASMVLSAAQVTALETFYVTTLEGGTAAFTFTHPRTGAAGSFRFTAPPTVQAYSPGFYDVALNLELMP